MILVIDNYDSFVHNLARYVRRLCDCDVIVLRNDSSELNADSLDPQALVVSPGPCRPSEAGKLIPTIDRFRNRIPILGVCLGHQAIIESFGGDIVVSDYPMHGRSSQVTHLGNSRLFKSIPATFFAGRYHSLIASSSNFPESLRVTATTADNTIMAMEHRQLPVFGVQFHPESILTEFGYQLLYNFLDISGLQPKIPSNVQELVK